jgi:thiol:disulfide interchange protein
MKMRFLSTVFLLGAVLTLSPAAIKIQAADEPKITQADIYDESADGSKQIAEALKTAKDENKHVLLQFGANWCPWCHKLHNLYSSDRGVAEVLKKDYVLVMIDVNQGRNQATDEKYGHPIKLGLPVLVVLDADGKQLTTKDSGQLEQGAFHSPQKVAAFLKQWAPKK